MSETLALSHLEALRTDTRDEIKRRIQQRDQYSMQQTVALGAIAVAAYSTNGTHWVFMLAPLVVTYFTALILYSYRIHDVLAGYLRTEIEPEFEALSGIPKRKEWENWYKERALLRVGVRRWFFVIAMWTVSVLSQGFVWYKEFKAHASCATWLALASVLCIYMLVAIRVTLLLRKEGAN